MSKAFAKFFFEKKPHTSVPASLPHARAHHELVVIEEAFSF